MTNPTDKIAQAAAEWCRENQFASHKDRGTSFIDGASFALALPEVIRLYNNCESAEARDAFDALKRTGGGG